MCSTDAPTTIDCSACEGHGVLALDPEGTPGAAFLTCSRCRGRGYKLCDLCAEMPATVTDHGDALCAGCMAECQADMATRDLNVLAAYHDLAIEEDEYSHRELCEVRPAMSRAS